MSKKKICIECGSEMEYDYSEGIGYSEAHHYACTNEDCGHTTTVCENGEIYES